MSELADLIFCKAVSEIAYAKAAPKAANGLRVTIDFALVDKARAHLVRISFGSLVTYADNQAGVRGAGLNEAVARTRALFLDKRYTYVAELDIQNCFGSVAVEELGHKFGIPKWVLDGFMTTKRKEEEGKIVPRNNYTRKEWNRIIEIMGYGLPQGSPASPLFAYSFIRGALEEFVRRFGKRVAVVNYCDNFLVLAPGRESMLHAIEFLRSVLKRHSAERFVLNPRSDVRRIADGINFLGYRFRRRRGQPVVDLPSERTTAYRRALRMRLAEIERPTGRLICDHETKLRDLSGWLRGILSSFNHASEAQFQAMWQARVIRRYRDSPAVIELLRWIGRMAPSDGGRRQALFEPPSPWDTRRFERWLRVPAWQRAIKSGQLSHEVATSAASFVLSKPWEKILPPRDLATRCKILPLAR
ncbi:hypothetical protein AU467_23570 [Mesorhizobium loti]|uniref:Reverse transcriptase domain-containing protein n=1 Tax=Rhizobium loti TaxID=381 RepID=A0A101KS55_RHILI|nr:hypothetical protein AU467_23570 [Mesorhizobium loti]